jgi:NADH-quinone oxidoreductase subunit M
MGFVLLGLMTLNQIGMTGAVMQMFSHGIIAGLLFAIVGRIVYERTHTRQLAELETMHLSKRLPFAAGAFVVAGLASIGMPGFSGFWAEMQVLVGAWKVNSWWAVIAGVGIIVGVAYTWRAMQKAFFSDALPSAHVLEEEHEHKLAAITWPEVTGVVMLVGVSLFVGVWPRILLDTIEPAVKTLLAGGAQ